MAMEVSCGQCHGRLLVETLGVVVACPHCGTHLSIPAPAAELPPPISDPPAQPPTPVPPSAPEVEVPAPQNLEPQAGTRFDQFAETMSLAAGVATAGVSPVADTSASALEGPDEPVAPAQIGWHSAPKIHLSGEVPAIGAEAQNAAPVAPAIPEPNPVPVADAAVATEGADLQLSSSQQFTLGTSSDATPATTPAPLFDSGPPAPPGQPEFNIAPGPTTSPLTFGGAPAETSSELTFGGAASPSAPTFGTAPAQATTAGDGIAYASRDLAAQEKLKLMLIVVASYASAVTIVLVYLLFIARNNALESLPDIKPPSGKKGEFAWKYIPPKSNVAPGHVLALGESRRFGNVKVTPLKVTRGIARFEHFSGQPGMDRIPTNPLLKLWVKFENVSRDQPFVPLDAYLLFTRDDGNLGDSVKANCFVGLESDRKQGKMPYTHFDRLAVTSEFRIIGQNLDHVLNPGESMETFIPSEEAASTLDGDLVWRVQFRKGLNPSSLRGVNTLIDVRFSSKDIQEEQGA